MAAPTSTLELLRSFTVPGLVQEEILRRIKSGELAAGAKLNEVDLAEHLQISRSPVREAFRALEEAGLVRLEKNRGAFIREISDAEAAELYQVRGMMEEACGRLLAPIITLQQLQELSTALDALESSFGAGGLKAYVPLNVAFHDRLLEMTGNVTLLRLHRQVVNRMHLMRRRAASAAILEAAFVEHRQILRALATRDPITAATAMANHVLLASQRMLGSGTGASELLGTATV